MGVCSCLRMRLHFNGSSVEMLFGWWGRVCLCVFSCFFVCSRVEGGADCR